MRLSSNTELEFVDGEPITDGDGIEVNSSREGGIRIRLSTVFFRYNPSSVDAGICFLVCSVGADSCDRATGIDNQGVFNNTLAAACFLSVELTDCAELADAKVCGVCRKTSWYRNATSTSVKGRCIVLHRSNSTIEEV